MSASNERTVGGVCDNRWAADEAYEMLDLYYWQVPMTAGGIGNRGDICEWYGPPNKRQHALN